MQDVGHRSLMEREREAFGGDRDVVHVDPDRGPPGFVLSDNVTIQCIHHCLERGRGVSEAKEHHGGFIESPLRLERCLVFVSCLNVNVVIPSSYVQLRVDHGPSQFSNQRGDEGERVLVAHCPCKEVHSLMPDLGRVTW